MVKKGQIRERLRETFLRFQAERLAALGRLIAARRQTPDLSRTKINANKSTITPSEKGFYYLTGFLDCIKYLRAVARTNPERLPALLRTKGGGR